MLLNCSHFDAPSITAASYRELEIAVIELVVRIMLYGKPIQIFTKISENFAIIGLESHGIGEEISPRSWNVRFIGPIVPLRMFAHTKSESICGMAYGKM